MKVYVLLHQYYDRHDEATITEIVSIHANVESARIAGQVYSGDHAAYHWLAYQDETLHLYTQTGANQTVRDSSIVIVAYRVEDCTGEAIETSR